jgi:hypothetical protein
VSAVLGKLVHYLKIDYLELKVLSTEVFLSPESYEKSDMTDGGRCCARDYVMKRGPTGAQCSS